MKRNKRLEKEIKRLRNKKQRGSWFFFYGGWILVALIILGVLFRIIVLIKNGPSYIPSRWIPTGGTCYIK